MAHMSQIGAGSGKPVGIHGPTWAMFGRGARFGVIFYFNPLTPMGGLKKVEKNGTSWEIYIWC